MLLYADVPRPTLKGFYQSCGFDLLFDVRGVRTEFCSLYTGP